jgi:glycosyltransferase involved in cell wall biosynthesis
MSDLLGLWSRSHAAVVPTTRDFVEGFNQVVIEAILSGRPVVTSEVCPALDYARPCAIEVPPEDVDAYAQAILTLVDDTATYERLRGNCRNVGMQFLDESKSFGAAVRRVLTALQQGREVVPIAHPPVVTA